MGSDTEGEHITKSDLVDHTTDPDSSFYHSKGLDFVDCTNEPRIFWGFIPLAILSLPKPTAQNQNEANVPDLSSTETGASPVFR